MILPGNVATTTKYNKNTANNNSFYTLTSRRTDRGKKGLKQTARQEYFFYWKQSNLET